MTDTPWGQRKVIDETADEWVKIQTKTFTRWCNSHLKERQIKIEDLFADVNDGTVLLNLLEIIGKETVLSTCGRKFYPSAKCKMDIHKLENCNLIIDYLKKRELKLVNIGSSDIKDGNVRLVLGLIWTIILRFAISEDGKEGLLLWCRKNTQGYEKVDVQNFNRSWQDGLAFCALIHKFRPDLINFQECLECGDDMTNLNRAFEVAKTHLDIDALLDAEDIAGSAKPDEKSIIAYLSLYFAKFASLAQQDAMADAIKKALAITMHHESLQAQYETDSEQLLSWIRVCAEKFDPNSLNGLNSTDSVKAVIDNTNSYKNDVKPQKQQLLASTEALLANLHLSQRNNERPLLTPKIEIEDLDGEFNNLDKAETQYTSESLALLDSFEKTDYNLQRFNNKITKVDEFIKANVGVFTSTNYGDSVSSCTNLLKKVQLFEQQTPKYQTMLASCKEYSGDCSDRHAGTADAKATNDRVSGEFDDLLANANAFKEKVTAQLAEETRLAQLKEDYENEATNFQFKIFEWQEALMEPVSLCNTVDAIDSVITRSNAVARDIDSSENELVALEVKSNELTTNNVPTDKSVEELRSSFDETKNNCPGRLNDLNDARNHQQAKQSARENFAKAASALIEYCSETTRVTTSLTRRMSMSPESQKEKLAALWESWSAEAPSLLDSVESCNNTQNECKIYVNTLTSHTIFSCRLVHSECEKNLKSAIEINAAHLTAMGQSVEMSAEQAREIREAFDNFDKDNSGGLTFKEFCDGLQGMGLVISADDAEAEFKRRDVDNNEVLNFDEFAGFILEQFQSGTSESDVLSAFKGLSGGSDVITLNVLTQYFAGEERNLNYILERMAGPDEAKEYPPFVADMFKI